MPKTMRRRLWELAESWWILPTFFLGLTPWVSFFYIGLRARQRKWIVAGAIYSILPITVWLLVPTPYYWTSVGKAIVFMMLVVDIISMIHAFMVRKEYLLRRDALNEIRRSGREEEKLRQRIAREYGLNRLPSPTDSAAVAARLIMAEPAGASSNSAAPVRQQSSGGDTPISPYPVDLNSADEQRLASLPGVGIIFAKRALSLRQTRNGFQSVEDFGQALGLKPHMIERIRPLVTVRPLDRPEQMGPAGRVVDY